MRLSTNKSGDLPSYFEKIDEYQSGIKVSSLTQILIDNHEQVARSGEIKYQLQLERFLVFLKKIQKGYEKLRRPFKQ